MRATRRPKMKPHTKTLPVFMALMLLAAVAMLLPLAALAAEQAPPATVTTPQVTSDPSGRTATLTWTAPTQYTDGSAITESLSYNVYEGLCSLTTLPKVATVTGLSTVRAVPAAKGGDLYCWQLSASTPNGGESALTGRGSKTFPFPKPNTTPTFSVQ